MFVSYIRGLAIKPMTSFANADPKSKNSLILLQMHRKWRIYISEFGFSHVVPGLLEYESIPGVLSSKPFGRGPKSRGKSTSKETEDIITVKDITNKVLQILFPCTSIAIFP